VFLDVVNRPRRVASTVVSLLALAMLGLTACTSANSTKTPSSATTTASTSPPSLSAAEPPSQGGSRVLALQGRGPTSLRLPSAVHAGTYVTIRITCSGAGVVHVVTAHGEFRFGSEGCMPGEVVSGAWTLTSRDVLPLRLQALPGTAWAVDVWAGNRVVISESAA
jgi:hypothetical protein